MAFSKQFEKALDELFKQRTHWLRANLGFAKPGKPPKFSREKVDKGIDHLQELASKAFSRTLARTQFNKHVKRRKNWFVKGHGWEEKKKLFKNWYIKLNLKKGYVYAFWSQNKECLYVGKTGSGGARPTHHFEKLWFARVKRVTVYAVKSKSQIPKLECLAIHRFQPTINKKKAAKKKWTKACPLCRIHRSIKSELRRIFRFR
jgi:hypothetical protein